MTLRVVVIGVGLEGLIASWVFRQHPHIDVWTIGDPPPGKRQDGPGTPLVHSESMGNLLREVGVAHASYIPRDGVLLRGKISAYPDELRRLGHQQFERVWTDIRAKAMLPPAKPNGVARGKRRLKKDRRLRCEFEELAAALTPGRKMAATTRWRVNPGAVIVDGKRISYDFLAMTAPLWSVRERVWFDVPEVSVAPLSLAMLVPREAGAYCKWDSVLTPYTPGQAIHRVCSWGAGYAAEACGTLDTASIVSDLNFLFPSGYDLQEVRRHRGPLRPLEREPRWPENIAPVGALAEWRQATLDEVLDRAYELLRRWTR
jgi:hypothetical protein